ncbi:MAG: peptidoglycan-associated lipoprotein Pal [Gammaproteobacteria bacterium]|nr:peptidoglycan-associated lipoprotein Pal [Gammaproteobacteria bacterium]
MKQKLGVLVLIAAVGLAACSSRGAKDAGGAGTAASGAAPGTVPGAGTAGPRANPAAATVGRTTSAASGVSGILDRVVYFDFDSSVVRADAAAVLDRWGKYLTANPDARIQLEGHADERGTREYNVGLGERRANAVQQALLTRGAGAKQFAIVSFGEERPVENGHDEAAWGRNRRVELVD